MERKLESIDEKKVYDENELNENQKKIISLLKRQTDYNTETILEKMKLFNNNIEKIILDYHIIDLDKKKKEEENNMTSNQKIFKSIRSFF